MKKFIEWVNNFYTIGDQPDDIYDQTKSLIMKYIKDKDTFILVVTPATEDVGNCEALTLARSVDPNGLRTLGVITKPDVREEGWDGATLVKILQNKISPLFKGYIAIKNRNKRQTDGGVTAQDNLKVK